MTPDQPHVSPLSRLIRFCLENKLVVTLLTLALIAWGVMVAPFDWRFENLQRDPVPVDAIPDIGENQQIVFTNWPGRSPQDIQDQISYPLTVSLLGVPGVKTIRSYSMLGFSTIYVIFKDDVEFYWSRSRVLERLSSLPPDILPDGARPALGPDATGMGQIYWYTLEGRDSKGNPAGGWDLDELRSIQDWYVRYGLQAADGVAEVASIGGFEKEYQIDVDPDAMRAHGVTLTDVFRAVQRSNVDVGARTIEINRVEYIIRGLGFIKNVKDIENSVIKARGDVPIYVRNIAHVSEGPALRRGALDKAGAEAVGGVVVARFGSNPLAVIQNVKQKIKDISPGLPEKILPDGTRSRLTIVPFYDRSGLIHETLGTLNHALRDEILLTIIVVLVMVLHLRSSILISGLLPMTVLATFILMKLFHVDANVVALSGIAIAIGTVVDMGIVICENMLKRLEESETDGKGRKSIDVLFGAASEVGGAVLTAVATTVVSFLPVFAMESAEGKLFKPLAFTKTFALIASVVVALTVLPPFAHVLFCARVRKRLTRLVVNGLLIAAGVAISILIAWWAGAILIAFGAWRFLEEYLPERPLRLARFLLNGLIVLSVIWIVAGVWEPLSAQGSFRNFLFVILLVGGLLGGFTVFQHYYKHLLLFCLRNKLLFLIAPCLLFVIGLSAWLGFDRTFGWLPQGVRDSRLGEKARAAFPGLNKEFMPYLDEGSFLYMPVTMPHASIGEAMEQLADLDMAIQAIPEVEQVVGKIGRVDSPLDPAPVSMIETVINYKSEYITDAQGYRLTYAIDSETGEFSRDPETGELIPDPRGKPYRQWRDEIHSPEDIWNAIVEAAKLPGLTSAPKLQPISTRIVMLQSGMRAPMGIKIKGPDLETIEKVGFEIERIIKNAEGVQPAAVIADRIVGKPYLEINIDRERIARYGIMIQDVQDVIEVALGGKTVTRTVEGRERYRVRVRYQRELRDSLETLGRILVPSPMGASGMEARQIPLAQLADIQYVRGPQVIKSEDTFLIGYVLFDKLPGYGEVNVVENAKRLLEEELADSLPAGVSYEFAGTYENQVRASRKLALILPFGLFAIFLILYLQFRSTVSALLVFVGVFAAWSGGFIMIWLYGQPWFLNFDLFGVSMRALFQVHQINLSVAVWVGFLALFGIATDDGVIMLTFIRQNFDRHRPDTVEEIRKAITQAGLRRIRPCLMTTATTILALLPVLTSQGRGADIMIPMAIPSFGGMAAELITLFVVPTLYCAIEEWRLRFRKDSSS